MGDRTLLTWTAAALVLLAAAADCCAQGLGRRFSMDELRQMVADSDLVVRARAAEEPVTVPGDTSGLAWRVTFDVINVERGQFADKTIEVCIESVIKDLNCSRRTLVGKEYVLPLRPFAQGEPGKFRLTADVGFAAGTPEAETLLGIATGKTSGTVASGAVRLRLEAAQAAYEVGKPILIKAVLENEAADPAAWPQAPFEVRDGELHIYNHGSLAVMNDAGANVPILAGLRVGAKPAPTTLPVTLSMGRAYSSEFDLASCVAVSRPGTYSVFMAVDGPDGQETVRSNFLAVQVIDSLSAPLPPAGERPPAAAEIRIPSPDAYQPGDLANGLVALLKPVSSEFEVGRPVAMELRLINASEMPINVDTRLERTILVAVQEQGASPAVRPVLQRINWPEDPDEMVEYPYAHLQPRAFWGRCIDVNSFYGRDALSLMEGGSAPPAPGSRVSYETHGMTLFSFDSPGVYKIQVTYQVKPHPQKGPRVWTGKLLTNQVFIRVAPGKGAGQAVP